MDVLRELELNGLVPVVVLDNADDAVPTANALLRGGIRVMEITMRTEAGLNALAQVAQQCPDMLVGAGTVLTREQGQACVRAGAKFIVAPGFDDALVRWCLDEGVPVTPGCVTPTEITKALSWGLSVVKFFPANVYGGLAAMKSLSAPFPGVRFIPTGGVGTANIAEFASAPCILAVGGSWVCSKQDIAAGAFDRITALSAEAVAALHGFTFRHVGINTAGSEEAEQVAQQFCSLFGFDCLPGGGSVFAGGAIEVVRGSATGAMGHIAVGTNHLARAVRYLELHGAEVDWDTAKYKGDRCIAVYLKTQMGGFGVHLLQR